MQPYNSSAGQQNGAFNQMYNAASQPAGFPQQQWNPSFQGVQNSSSVQNQGQSVYRTFPGYGGATAPSFQDTPKSGTFAPPYNTQSPLGQQWQQQPGATQQAPSFLTVQTPQPPQQNQGGSAPPTRPSGQSVFDVQLGQGSNQASSLRPPQPQRNATPPQNDLPAWTPPEWSLPQGTGNSGEVPRVQSGGQSFGSQYGGQAGGQATGGQALTQAAPPSNGQFRAGPGSNTYGGQAASQPTGQFGGQPSGGGQSGGLLGQQLGGQFAGPSVGRTNGNFGGQSITGGQPLGKPDLQAGGQTGGVQQGQGGVQYAAQPYGRPSGGSVTKQVGGQQNGQGAPPLGSQSGGFSSSLFGGQSTAQYGRPGGQIAEQTRGTGASVGQLGAQEMTGQQVGQMGGQATGQYGGQLSGQSGGQSGGQFVWASNFDGQSARQQSQGGGGKAEPLAQQSSWQTATGGQPSAQAGRPAVGQHDRGAAQYNGGQVGSQFGGGLLEQGGRQPAEAQGSGQFGGQSSAQAQAQFGGQAGAPAGQSGSQHYGSADPQQRTPGQGYRQAPPPQLGVQSWQQTTPPTGQPQQAQGAESPISPAHPPGYSPRVLGGGSGGLNSGGFAGQAQTQGLSKGSQPQQIGGAYYAGPSEVNPSYGQPLNTGGQAVGARSQQRSDPGQSGGAYGQQGGSFTKAGSGNWQQGTTFGQAEKGRDEPERVEPSQASGKPKVPLLSASELEGLHKFVEFGEKVLQQVHGASGPPAVNLQPPAVAQEAPAVSRQAPNVNQPAQVQGRNPAGQGFGGAMPQGPRGAFGMQAPPRTVGSVPAKAEAQQEVSQPYSEAIPAKETPAEAGVQQSMAGQQPGAQAQQLSAQAQAAFLNPYAMFERKTAPPPEKEGPQNSAAWGPSTGNALPEATVGKGVPPRAAEKPLGSQSQAAPGAQQPARQQGPATAGGQTGQQAKPPSQQGGQFQQPNVPLNPNQAQQGQPQQALGAQPGQPRFQQQPASTQFGGQQPMPSLLPNQAQFQQASPSPQMTQALFQQAAAAGQMNQPQLASAGQLYQTQTQQQGAQPFYAGFQQPSPQPNQLLPSQQQMTQYPFQQQQFAAQPTAHMTQQGMQPQALQNQGSGQQPFAAPSFGAQPQTASQGLQNQGSGQQQFGSPGFGGPPVQNDAERVKQMAMAVVAQQNRALLERRSQQAQQKPQGPTKQNTPMTPLQQLAALKKQQEEEEKRSQQGVQSPAGRPPQGQHGLSVTSPPPVLPPQMQPSPSPMQQPFGGQPMGVQQVALQGGQFAHGQFAGAGQAAPGVQAVPGVQRGLPGKLNAAGVLQQGSGGQSFGQGQGFGAGLVVAQGQGIQGQSFGRGQTVGQVPAGVSSQAPGFGQAQTFGLGQSSAQGQAFGQSGQPQGQAQGFGQGQSVRQGQAFGQFGQGQGLGPVQVQGAVGIQGQANQGFRQAQGVMQGQGVIQGQGVVQGQGVGQAQPFGQGQGFVQGQMGPWGAVTGQQAQGQARPGFQPQPGGASQVQPGQIVGQQMVPSQGLNQGQAGAGFPNQGFPAGQSQFSPRGAQIGGPSGAASGIPTGGGFGMGPWMGSANPPGLSMRPGTGPGGQPRAQGPSQRGSFQARGKAPQQGLKRPLAQMGGPAGAPERPPHLRCEPCEKEFSGQDGYTAHMEAHEKCSEPGCGFEASGKVLKEHKLSAHAPANKLGRARAAANTNANETEEDVKKWREERRKHYPTETNVQKKAEEAAARRARGELEDAEGAARRARLREILQQQRALGVMVAEIPPYLLRDSATTRKRPGGEEGEAAAMLEGPGKRQAAEGPGGRPERGVCFFFLRGRCKKGRRCQFLHQRTPRGERGPGGTGADRRRQNQGAKRAPTLLEKLLAPEIRKDKSHLLQSFRFMVNNNFFLEWPQKPLRFFEWTSQEEPAEETEDGGEVPEQEDGESDYESAGEEDEAALALM